MLSTLIASAALTLASQGATAAPLPEEGHDKLPWFEGSWEELLKEAEVQDKIIFLDFWADW